MEYIRHLKPRKNEYNLRPRNVDPKLKSNNNDICYKCHNKIKRFIYCITCDQKFCNICGIDPGPTPYNSIGERMNCFGYCTKCCPEDLEILE